MGTNSHFSNSNSSDSKKRNYRISQFIAFLFGARVFTTILLTFALYVSTFFLFNNEESLKEFFFDYKVHGIIFCTVFSVLAGGIINQFYDLEKDVHTKPFRTRLQQFLQQKYYLYAYILFNVLSLGLALLISYRVLFFFLFYQFLMWIYSHKLSKILIVNNITFVSITLYPFFGMLVYYQTFSTRILVMALFLFLMLIIIDINKDFLTRNVDKVFGYSTLPNTFGNKITSYIVYVLMVITAISSLLIFISMGIYKIMSWYFILTSLIMAIVVVLLENRKIKSKYFALNLLRFWILMGVFSMLLDGVAEM